MKYKAAVFLLMVILECNGQVPILGDILSTAHKGVESVAGSILGGLNILGGNRRNRYQNMQQTDPGETIIIVVEEPSQGDYGNNHGPMHHHPPPHHHHHRHGRPPFDDGSRPPPPPPPHGRPPFDEGSGQRPPPPHHGRPPFDDGSRRPPPPHDPYYQRPHGDPTPNYNNQNQGHQNGHGTNQNPNNGQNGNNFYGNNENGRPYDNNNGNSGNNYQDNSKGTQEDQEKNYYDKPTTEYIRTPEPTKYPQVPNKDESHTTTQRPSDRPLFVPLNPNEYIYGGDKINITAPKRDTDKNEESNDENFDIDIRLKN